MIISNIDQVIPEWLTAVLQQDGALSKGSVETVQKSPLASDNSHIWQLVLTYSEAASGERPSRLLLKMVADEDFGNSEVHYYRRDYVDVPDAPLVHCYDAAFTQFPTPHYHLLLADHSTTHQAQWQVKPTLAYGRSLAHALAVLHARWWGQVPGSVADLNRLWAYVYPGLEPMLRHAANEIPADWSAKIRELCDPIRPLLSRL